MSTPQSFANHGRTVIGYHVVTSALLFAAVVLSSMVVVRDPSLAHMAMLVLSAGVMIGTYYARSFPLGVQDRVIRLEERLRLERLLPEDLRGRLGELTTEQLIGLRFASDEEVAELTRRVLAEGISDRKAIKALVKDWRPDHARI